MEHGFAYDEVVAGGQVMEGEVTVAALVEVGVVPVEEGIDDVLPNGSIGLQALGDVQPVQLVHGLVDQHGVDLGLTWQDLDDLGGLVGLLLAGHG